MAIDNIPNLAWLKTAPPLQKRRAAAVGKWHSACPEVRLYRSKVSGEKDIAPLRADDKKKKERKLRSFSPAYCF